MKTVSKSQFPHAEHRRKFISEAFHAFHQPLTSLHCGLELSLLKQRTGEEYRERLANALTNASAILELNQALRELVEANDPGEGVGVVELKSFTGQLAEEVTYTAEASLVAVRTVFPSEVSIKADSRKLKLYLGNLASSLVCSLEPGGALRFVVERHDKQVVISIECDGKRRKQRDNDLRQKLDLIRADAACSYTWTLGGEFKKTKTGFTLLLPLLD